MPAPRQPVPRTPARRAFTAFAGSVLVLHIVALLLWRVLDIGGRPLAAQNWFAGGWIVLTLVLIVVGLRRVRAARHGGRAP